MNKKTMFAFFALGTILLLALSFVSATNSSANNRTRLNVTQLRDSINRTRVMEQNRTDVDVNRTRMIEQARLAELRGKVKRISAKLNLSFGNCTSDVAKQQNDCFDAIKQAKSTCENSAKQNETAQHVSGFKRFWSSVFGHAECNHAYKNATSTCKTDFQSAKEECKQAKG